MQPKDYNYIISRLFAPQTIDRLGTVEFHANLIKLSKTATLDQAISSDSLKEMFDGLYRHMKENYRCEYFYKNQIVNQLLIEKHSDNSAVLLSEFAVGTKVADIVIVNGQSSAYEIKTELDNFDRLNEQLSTYVQVFDKVNVVTYRSALKQISEKILDSVGIIVLNESGRLLTKRLARCNSGSFNKSLAANCLRQNEIVSAFSDLNGFVPEIGSAKIGRYCRDWFSSLDNMSAQKIFRNCLKQRKPSKLQFELLIETPESLRCLVASKKLNKSTCNKLKDIFETF